MKTPIKTVPRKNASVKEAFLVDFTAYALDAQFSVGGDYDIQLAQAEAERLYRAFRAAVRAVVPGRQQRGNLEALMHAAHKAAARALKSRPTDGQTK